MSHTADLSTEKNTFGFWVYLMTDCVLFASLFATYAVLQANTFGGPSARELFDLNFVLIETILLLTSSLTCGLAVIFAYRNRPRVASLWLWLTVFLGASFIGMELYEFHTLVTEGHSWRTSGFLSAFFTLVGTHGLHITVGLLWAGVLLFVIQKRGSSENLKRKLLLFSLFWHFLDVVWIFIFSIVYLLGAIV